MLHSVDLNIIYNGFEALQTWCM